MGGLAEFPLYAILRHARERGGAPAYWTPARTWTFAELAEASGRIASGLKSLGVGPGDRVACLTKMTADCVALVLGANRIGAVCMPVNCRLAPPEIEYIVKDGKAKLMMADRAFPFPNAFVTEEFPAWYGTFEANRNDYQPGAEDTALQLYSSGTTGLPKGVELTHGNLAAGMVDAVPAAIGYHGAPDVMLKYGAFINAVITFVIVAWAVFLLVKAMNVAEEKLRLGDQPPADVPPPPKEVLLLREIRDELKKT